ncbi:MAG: helix-turn-helix transcriptional regulator [Gillisia sp.]
MVNSEKFAQRLQKILDQYDLSAAAFADSIDVGRSSISHILSGRNKPSLDFVLKIVQNYPEVELYWLLNGKGDFPKTTENASNLPNSRETAVKQPTVPGKKEVTGEPDTFNERKISKIVIFYSDGSFEAFHN